MFILILVMLTFLIQFNTVMIKINYSNRWQFLYVLIVFLILLTILIKTGSWLKLELNGSLTVKSLLLTVFVASVIEVFTLSLQIIFNTNNGETNNLIARHFLSHNSLVFFMTFIIVNITGPILEELLFRGLILQFAGRLFKSVIIGIIISAAIFSFLHNGQLFLSVYFINGLGLGWLFVKTKSITTSILCHQLLNVFATLQLFLI